MASLLWSTQTVVTETPLPASATLKSALALLHDHALFQAQQPLALSNSPIPAPSKESFLATKALSFCSPDKVPEYRSVTIDVPLGVFGASTTIVTHSAFVDTDDGMYVVFQAPMSLNGWSKWSVVEAEGEGEGAGGARKGLRIREESNLTGLRFLMPFVVGTEKESHKEFQRNFAKRLESTGSEGGNGGGSNGT
ncbi:hypothetical protein VTL71DRAFT_6600 [Oculimacula yallundae]|uniref:DUF7053 domain-containing protein n=1 Tax=Oculimacula yallundae TaxID=86028 RepID=A0ABR4BXD6_9HELO